MLKSKSKTVRLKNLLSNEVWICEDITNIKNVDGVEFVEVHKEFSNRKFWHNKSSLTKIKENSKNVKN